MKILSNFDTSFAKNLQTEYEQIFGVQNVLLLRKARLLWYVHLIPHFIGWAIVSSVGYFVIRELAVELPERVMRVFYGLVVVWLLILILKSVSIYVSERMDFLIATPKEIMKYDQKGIFSRNAEKIAADKIKTISLKKEGFIRSLFDIGTLTFLAEGELDAGNIVMEDVANIEFTEKKIRHILGQDTM